MTRLRFLFLFLLFVVTANIYSQTKTKLPSEKDMAAYLMVYFKDDTHGLYFAISKGV